MSEEKSIMFSTRLKESTIKALDDFSKKTGIKKSRIIEDALEAQFKKPQQK